MRITALYTFNWVDQPPRLHHIDGALLGPVIQLLPVGTLVRCGVGNGHQAIVGPLIRDDAHVGKAHDRLAKEIEAVLYFEVSNLGSASSERGVPLCRRSASACAAV